MNGFEFAGEALSIKEYKLDSIIELADSSEVDWLEFKAAIKAQNSAEENISDSGDYIFNLVKALVSMANGSGGLVVLGIDDKGDAVGLEVSGFAGDKDKFTRDISDKVLLRDGWRTKKGHWRWKNESDQLAFNPQWAKRQGHDVLAFNVAPREASLGPVVLTQTKNKNAPVEEVVFIRTGGDRGRIVSLPVQDVDNWWAQRDLTLNSSKFKTWIKKLQKTAPAVYHSRVSSYCAELVANTAEAAPNYVPLEADARIPTNKRTEDRHQSDDGYLPSTKSSPETKEWRGGFQEIISTVSSAFLIGEPGSGKTTSLLMLARYINAANSSEPEKWALYVSLAGFTAGGLQELICREVSPLNWHDILLALQSDGLTLILDGLNECPSQHSAKCEQDVSDLLKECPKSRIIVSTRLSSLPPFAENIIELRFMGTSQQQQFVRNYLDDCPEDCRLFWDALRQKPTGQMIARSPILLRISASVWKDTDDFPSGLAELYDSFFDAWIDREIKTSSAAGETVVWAKDEIKESLALLAYSMRCDGLVACTQSYAEDRLQINLGDRSKLFTESMVQGLMIERAQSGATIRFRHETIQEFLVAIFLTSYPERSLVAKNTQRDSRWSMPIIFAFELFDRPPKHFIKTAWQLAPLLVCAAFRDDEKLKSLPEPSGRYPTAPQNDDWLIGVIRCMRGEGVEERTFSLAYRARTPSRGQRKKHPLPQELIAAFEGMAFWYALRSYEEGCGRIERLKHLIIDPSNLWLELLPHVMKGQPDWLVDLNSAQKLLVGERLTLSERSDALDEASVCELCYMYRNGIITKAELQNHWRKALNFENEKPLELELLALLSTKAIRVGQLNRKQAAVVKDFVKDPYYLSPNLIKAFVQDRLIRADEVREDSKKIRELVDAASPIRAKQLIEHGVIKTTDYNRQQLDALFRRMSNEKDINFIIDSGLVKSRQDIPKEIINYCHGDRELKKDAYESHPVYSLPDDAVTDSSEAVSSIYLSDEELLLRKIRIEIEEPRNASPQNGYHRELTKHVEASAHWAGPERDALIDMAEIFFRKNASKKRQKEYRNLIREARQAKRAEDF